MRLKSFSITNFRSIETAHKIDLSNISTIVGKNNEGKSNILRALNISMGALKLHWIGRKPSALRRIREESEYYDWDNDFPVRSKNRKGKKETIFRLEFSLSEEEIRDFYKKIDSYVNWSLIIEIKFDNTNMPVVHVVKSWRDTRRGFGTKSQEIAEYIVKHIAFTYIPAVRTEELSTDIIHKMVGLELSSIEASPSFKEAFQKIAELQEPVLNELSEKIKNSLVGFLPSISDVKIQNSWDRARSFFRRDFDILINDGNETKLENKWDGVKSLVALSLLKDSWSKDCFSLVAIEEPESHLHPWAIHLLRNAVYELWNTSQVIITTHNPLFVNREELTSNILIDAGKAKPARNIKDIREMLGVRASDNLVNARYVIVVEGLADARALKALFLAYSEKLRKAFADHIVIIDPARWAAKLEYKLQMLQNALCSCYVVFDRDNEWKLACEKALAANLITHKDYTLLRGSGFGDDSEFEDMIAIEVYKTSLESTFWIQIDTETFKRPVKWSNKMKEIFLSQGKIWDSNVEWEVKEEVAKCVERQPTIALKPHEMGIFQSLLNSLEKLIEQP